jgi:hypothetical protein
MNEEEVDVNAEAPAAETQEVTEESFTAMDPNSLPPEVQDAYRSMQADYTRKTQEIAKIRAKADLLDKVMANPQAKVQLGESQEPYGGAKTRSAEVPEPDFLRFSPAEEKMLETLDKESRDAVELISTKKTLGVVHKAVAPLAQAIQDSITQVLGRLQALEAQTQFAAHPEAKGHEKEVLALMGKGLTMEQAIGAVTYGKRTNGSTTQATKRTLGNGRPSLANQGMPSSARPAAGRYDVQRASADALAEIRAQMESQAGDQGYGTD